MDKKPFFIFNIMAYSEEDARELKKFGKKSYEEETILSTATSLKYGRLLDSWVRDQLSNPSDEIIQIAGKAVYDGRLTASVTEWLGGLLRSSMTRVIKARVRENLQSALDQGSAGSDSQPEEGNPKEELTNDNGVITTPEETDAYRVVQAIASEFVDPDRVIMRDAKSYCAILLDDNNRKPICRLRFEGRQWRIGTFKQKDETLNDINKISDIYKLRQSISDAINEYISE